MFDVRQSLALGLLSAAALGVGSLISLVIGAAYLDGAGASPLKQVISRVSALQAQPGGYSSPTSDILAMSIFAAPATDPGEATGTPPAQVRLLGLARTPKRKAALVSVNGATPVWVELGRGDRDVQLLDLDHNKARIRTAAGEADVVLFQNAAPESGTTAGANGAETLPPAQTRPAPQSPGLSPYGAAPPATPPPAKPPSA